ncbi:unnamed protein product [Rotaria sp. Silwood2]|nr:unnamed protein product [Rotaria sp. Silwood2]
MANKLSQIVLDLQSHPNGNGILYKVAYRQAISLPDTDDDVGSLYIHLCECLFIEISHAEFCSIFPNVSGKMDEWTCRQDTGDGFQPKIFDLIKAIEQDLMNHWSNPCFLPRTKIGVIGYTSAGKSSVLNRLLGVSSLSDDDAAPVRTIKSTYYQLQFDRQEPLIYPPNRDIKIPVTFIDIQGLDKDRPTVNDQIEAGNYLDEIRKANCDIYVLVFDDQLCYEQEGWINYIEQKLKRKCVLVRSKVDICYLKKFRELANIPFGRSRPEQRSKYDQRIIEQIRYDIQVKSRHVFLTAADYDWASIDAEMLLSAKSFDHDELVDKLSYLAFNASHRRIHLLTMRAVTRVINTCFRRGYVLNVLKYQILAGVAAIIPCGDQLPRYLSRNSIKEAFGINDAFCQYLTQFNLIIQNDSHLQTSVFKKYVVVKAKTDSEVSARTIGTVTGHTAAVVGSFSDDIIRIVAPATTTVSRVASVTFTVATIGIGVVISAGVCAWSAVKSGQHIFSYVNRICDDLILVSNPLIASIIGRETEKTIGSTYSTTSK